MSDKLQFVVAPRQAKAYRTSNWPITRLRRFENQPGCEFFPMCAICV